jgi:pterin-4a-carbinolamine dehydratase
MSRQDAERLKSTVHEDWRLDGFEPSNDAADGALSTAAVQSLVREFRHPDYLAGARFVERIAAVAQLNDHYPSIALDRLVENRQWQVVTTVTCHTLVLGGLSVNDFHIAMVGMHSSYCLWCAVFGASNFFRCH